MAGAAFQLPLRRSAGARLKPEGPGGGFQVQYWLYRNRWKDVGDMGGLVIPLDEALEVIAETEIFWT